MIKRYSFSVSVILFIILSTFFTSCSQGLGSKEITSVTPSDYAILYYDTNYSTSGTAPKPAIVKVGDTITVAANTGNLAKTGWTFSGWCTNPDGSGAIYTPGMTLPMPSESLTFYALWQGYEYSIIFDCQGATTQAGYLETTIKSPMTIPETLPSPPSNTGLVFSGWWTEPNGGGTELTATTKVTSSMTVYAYWTSYYTITFDSQDATVPATPATRNVALSDTTIDALPSAPAKMGYIFDGWWTQANGGGTEFKATTTVTARMTVYAKWTPIFYAVTYVLNGGTNSALNPATYTIKTTEITFADATRSSYFFAGWYTDSSFRTKITGIPPQTTGAVTVYAKWTLEVFPITYVLNGAINNFLNPSSYTTETASFSLGDAFLSGYDFKGWYSDSGFTTKVTGITAGSTGNVTLYAKWAPTNYSITYNLNGGSNAVANPASYTIESNVILIDATRTDYIFKGWYTDSSCTSKVNGISPGSIGNITVFAKWLHVPYPISYVLNGGINSPSNPAAYSEDGEAITYAAPSRIGYDFSGWYSDIGLTTKVIGIAAGSNGNITIYAKWEATSYPINYVLNGGINDGSIPTNYTIESSPIIFLEPYAAGYVFAGWFSDSSLTNKVTSIASGSNGIVTVYAKWYPKNGIHATVSIPGDGTVTFSSNSLTVVKGLPLTISIEQMSYAKYAWYLDLAPISGAEGSSVSIATRGLLAGMHELMIVVTDSKGKSSSASCRFSVIN